MSQSMPRGRRLEEEDDLATVVRQMATVAVVGMKGADRPDESAFAIPVMLQYRGVRVIPINPKLTEELGERAYPTLAAMPDHVDVVDVFRRIDAIPSVVDDVLALPPERRPRVVWLQSGIRHPEATERLLAAGIDVVEDACLGVYASRYRRD
jgi:predicted CoA-binding protein